MNSDRMHCYICEEVLSPNSSLKNHVETVHGDKEYEHECNICTKTFSNATNLQTLLLCRCEEMLHFSTFYPSFYGI